jgi:restriction endonuclease S subunit
MPLGELVSYEPDYGSGERAIPIQSPNDVKYIRITDFDDDGIVPGNEFATVENIENRYRLDDGDVLFARSGATAGKTFIYSSDIGPSIFAGYCIRFRFDREKALPQFIYFYTKTNRYQAWVRSIQRPSGQPNINKEEFKSFTVPRPTLPVQRALVSEMEAARESRRRKLAEADALLSGLDAFLLDRLGLTVPKADMRLAFGIRRAEGKDGRIDVQNFLDLIRFRFLRKGSYPTKRLGDVAQIVMGQAPEGCDYNTTGDGLPLIAGAADLGEEFPNPKKWTRSAPKTCKKDDIILCIRATIGDMNWADKVYCLGRGVASIRPKNLNISREYLYAVLYLERDYLASRGTGSTFRQIIADELADCPVPLAPDSVQEKIAKEVEHRRLEARRLREEAAREWEAAKARFEARLLGREGSSK